MLIRQMGLLIVTLELGKLSCWSFSSGAGPCVHVAGQYFQEWSKILLWPKQPLRTRKAQ